MNQRDLATYCRAQLRQCDGYDTDQIATQREQALDYYLQRPRGDEIEGRSAAVAGTLSSMVEANLAQISEAFFSAEQLAIFQPTSSDDEAQAAFESDVVSRMLLQEQNGFLVISACIKDALLLRNGVGQIEVVRNKERITRTYHNVQAEALPSLLNIPGMQTISADMNEEEGILKCVYESISLELKNEAVPIEDFMYSADHNNASLESIRFCARRRVETRSALKSRGFPSAKVNEIPAYRPTLNNNTARARNPQKYSAEENASPSLDPASDLIEWYECYPAVDYDSDGTTERRRVCVAGTNLTTVLSNEPYDCVPFYAGTAFLMPHRFRGISLYDKLRQEQDKATGLERALFDNINAANKNRLGYLDGVVNVDDVDNGRINGSIRVRRGMVQDVRQALYPFQVPDLSSGILLNLKRSDQTRSEMGGAALDLATGNTQLGDRVGSQGVDRAYSVQERLASLMTKTLSTTLIRSMYLLAHKIIRTQWDAPLTMQRSGVWQSTNPAQWMPRKALTVNVGGSPMERDRKALILNETIKLQATLAASGMENVLVDVNKYHAAVTDWLRANDIQNAERYLIDPRSPQSQQAMQAKQQQAQVAQQQQQQFVQQAVALEQLRTAFDKYKQDSDLTFKYFEAVLGAEISEAEMTSSALEKMLNESRPFQQSPTLGEPDNDDETTH
jgi:hypothetical protein